MNIFKSVSKHEVLLTANMQTLQNITSLNFNSLIEQVKENANQHYQCSRDTRKFLSSISTYFCLKFATVEGQNKKMNVSLKFNRKDFLKDFEKDQEMISTVDHIFNNEDASKSFFNVFIAHTI